MADFELTYHEDEIESLSGHYDQRVEAELDMERVSRRIQFPSWAQDFVRDLIVAVREEWADEAWAIFDAHGEVKIVTLAWKRIPWIRFTVRVKHCGPLIRLIVGPRPR
jgi:hypothetical protein